MGVKVERVLTERKGNAVISSVSSGAVPSPAAGSLAIVSVLDGSDVNRFADIERAMHDCYEYMRENNKYGSSGTISYVVNINASKRDVQEKPIVTDIVTGDVGVMINGNIRNTGKTTIIEAAFKQLIDYAREQGSLGEFQP